MTRHRNPDGEFVLGELIEAAFGLDREWMSRASCRMWQIDDDEPRPTPWQVSRNQEVDGMSGVELIKMALLMCGGCSAQFDCARFAIRGRMKAGTWGMGITNLKWLQGIDEDETDDRDPIGWIDYTEWENITVDSFVTALRTGTTLQPMPIQHALGRVEIYGGITPDGEAITLGAIDTLGESPKATAKLYQWEGAPVGGRFVAVDRMTSCRVTVRGKALTVEGVSDQMREEVGLQSAEATVRWEMAMVGCDGCG